MQTEAESNEIHCRIRTLLDIHNISYIEIDGDGEAVDKIVDIVNHGLVACQA